MDSPIFNMVEILANAIRFDTGMKIIEEQPDELVDFSFDQFENNDITSQAIGDQKMAIESGVRPKYIYKQ